MSYQEKPRDVADGCRPRTNKALDPEQCLMLLRRQPLTVCRRFAEGQKAPHLIAKLRKSLVVRIAHDFPACSWPGRHLTRRSLRLSHPVLWPLTFGHPPAPSEQPRSQSLSPSSTIGFTLSMHTEINAQKNVGQHRSPLPELG